MHNQRTYVPPPPFMIFGCKLEICQSHSYKSSDNQQDDEDNKQDAVYGIDPVAPDTGKYVVKLNVNSTKWKKSSHCHLRNRTPVPRQWWNLSRILCGAAGSLELSLAIFSSNTTQNKQGRCHQCPYEDYYYNSSKRQCSSCSVCNSNRVKEAECEK